MKQMKLEIDRSKWYRGKGDYDSRLVKKGGKMCCLGFLGVACGVTKVSMLNQAAPRNVGYSDTKGVFRDLIDNGKNTHACGMLMETNDDPNLTERKREASLRKQLKEIGVNAKFIN